jgi:hypothetical protein
MAHTTEPTPVVRALYHDDDVLISAVKEIRAAGYKISEVYTPFPVHGLDKAMGLKETRIAMAAFMYGVLGLTVAVTLTWYMMISDWPQNIGGKPNYNWGMNMPAFVPILFELTVFFAAHLMVWTYLIINGLYPGSDAQNPDPRTTDDHFMVELPAADGLVDVLKKSGAVEIAEA